MNLSNYFKNAIITVVFLLIPIVSIGQEHIENDPHQFKHFRLSTAIGHSYIPEARTETNKFIIIPVFALDIQYWFNNKWGITLKNDIEISNYVIEDENNNVEYIRSQPIIISLPVLFSPWENRGFNFILGPGIEFEEHKNLSILRVGFGSEFELGNHWDFAPEIIYDLKDGHINSLTLAFGVGKRF